MKERKKPTQRTRAKLQKEAGSRCPICGNEDVGEFQVHHLDGNPANDAFQNLLLLCPNCHAKFTNGTLTSEDGYRAKMKLVCEPAGAGTLRQSEIVQINHGDRVVQAAGTVNIRMTRARNMKAAVPVSGVVGTSPAERAYIKHLYDRLIDYKRAIPKYDAQRAGRTVARYVRDAFGTSWSYVPIGRFRELVELLQRKIDATPIGRKHAKDGTKSYSTFEEFQQARSVPHIG